MKGRAVTVLLVLVLLSCASNMSLAMDEMTIDQVILVLWHGLTWDDVDAMQWDVPAAWGLLNTRGGGGETLSAAHLSIGAGARAVGLRGIEAFLQEGEGESLFRLHTGLDPSKLVQANIALLHDAQTVSYRLELGALGSALAEAGLSLRVLGNSDHMEKAHWAALVGMDHWGRVWNGSVGREFSVSDSDYPFGVRTDYAYLAREVLQATDDLIIVDLGDPFRFDQYQMSLVGEQREVLHGRMISEARAFLQEIVRQMSTQTIVLVVSPHPPQALANQGYWLTPAFFLGLREGLLTSATTRWPGLITNMDLAPTICRFLQIDHQQPFIGRTATIEPEHQAQQRLAGMDETIHFLYRYRGQVLRAAVVSQIVVYSLILVSLIASASLPNWHRRLLQAALVLLLAVPVALLFWDQSSLLVWGFLLLTIALIFKFSKPLLFVGIISLLTTLALSIDILAGSPLIRSSFLGYDPVGGARFYGVGNEYMGVLVGAAIMGWTVLAEVLALKGLRVSLGLAFFVSLVTIIGAPFLGTNVGGAISAIFGFGSILFSLANKRVSWRTSLVIVLGVVVVLGAFMWFDGGNSSDRQSHIGQTVELIRRDGIQAIILIITRKLAMNIRLMRYSLWSRALIVTLLAMGASFIWPSKFIFWLRENHPLVAKGISGVVIASVAAFVFNDSGVVAAATCLSFGSSTLLLLALELKHNLATPQAHIKNDGDGDDASEHGASPSRNKR